jgi:hypothetical protein
MTADVKNETMLAALRDQASEIRKNLLNGNKSDARLQFNRVPHHRVAYVTWALVCMMTPGDTLDDLNVDDLERFFRSVTD